MPTCSHPCLSHHHRKCVVQLQCNNRSSATDCPANDECSVLTPNKMSWPALIARIEQRYPPSRERVSCSGLNFLESITHAAGEPEVLFTISAPLGLRKKMINLQRAKYVLLCAQTIATAIIRLYSDLCLELLSNQTATHGSSGARRPRRTASCNACAFRNRPLW
jgi:hypothetical protein